MTSLIWRWWHTQFLALTYTWFIHRYTRQIREGRYTCRRRKLTRTHFIWSNLFIYMYILMLVFYTWCCEMYMFFSFFLYNWCYCWISCASHIRSGGGALGAERKNFKLLFSAGIVLLLGFRIYIFRPMRMTDAILPGWPPTGQYKRLCIAPSSSLLHWLFLKIPAAVTDQHNMRWAHSTFGPEFL